MNGDSKRVVISTDFGKHEDINLWSVTFKVPDEEFLHDFQWEVYFKGGQPRLPWQAMSMTRNLAAKTLEIRFWDLKEPPFEESDRTRFEARLVSPSS